MDQVTLRAEPRTETGSRPARRLRRDGRIPAVVYGLENELVLFDTGAGDARLLADVLEWERVTLATWVPVAEGNAGAANLYVIGRAGGESVRGLLDVTAGTFEADDAPFPLRVFEILISSVPGRSVAVGRSEGTVGLWQLDAGQEPRLLAEGMRKTGWALSGGGRRLATLAQVESGWSEVRLFDLEAGTSRRLAGELDTSYQGTTMALRRHRTTTRAIQVYRSASSRRTLFCGP